MVPFEDMVTSETLEVKNVGQVPVAFKVIHSSDLYYFLVQPRMGRIDPGCIAKIVLLFRGGLLRQKPSVRIDFAPLSSQESRKMTAAGFWNAKQLGDVYIHGIPISKMTFQIEIVEFNIQNGMFESQLFASLKDGRKGKPMKSIGQRLEGSGDINAINQLAMRASLFSEANATIPVAGDGKNRDRDIKGVGTRMSADARNVKLRGRDTKRVVSGGGDSSRLGRMGGFRRTLKREGSPASMSGGDGNKTRSLRRQHRPSGYGGFARKRSSRRGKKPEEESIACSSRSFLHEKQHDQGAVTRTRSYHVQPNERAPHEVTRTRYYHVETNVNRPGRMHRLSSPRKLCKLLPG